MLGKLIRLKERVERTVIHRLVATTRSEIMYSLVEEFLTLIREKFQNF